MKKNEKLKMLDVKEIEKFVESIEKEKEEEADKKKQPGGQKAAS